MTHNPVSHPFITNYIYITIYLQLTQFLKHIQHSEYISEFKKGEFITVRPLNWFYTVQLICAVNGFRCCAAQCHPCLPNHLKQRSNSAAAMSKSAKTDPIRNEVLCS